MKHKRSAFRRDAGSNVKYKHVKVTDAIGDPCEEYSVSPNLSGHGGGFSDMTGRMIMEDSRAAFPTDRTTSKLEEIQDLALRKARIRASWTM